jgi:hypothetical protein
MTIKFERFQEAHENYSSVKAHNEESWKPVLEILEEEGWEPEEYLDFVFKKYRKPMVPKLLSSKEIVDAYREERRIRIEENQRRAVWALDQVQNRLCNKYTVMDILTDKELENNALLMYLIAASDKNEEFMDKFREAALYELKTMPELKEIFSVPFHRRLFPC